MKERRFGKRSIVIGFLSLINFALSSDQQASKNLFETEKSLLILIDSSSFFCPLCLESFIGFCEILQSKGWVSSTFGVLIYNESDNEKDTKNYVKMLEKQLRGFLSANNIQFPIILDKFQVFDDLNIPGAVVILFDKSRKMVKRYKLPLCPQDRSKRFSLFSIIQKWKEIKDESGTYYD